METDTYRIFLILLFGIQYVRYKFHSNETDIKVYITEIKGRINITYSSFYDFFQAIRYQNLFAAFHWDLNQLKKYLLYRYHMYSDKDIELKEEIIIDKDCWEELMKPLVELYKSIKL